jgi:drug/metabolite transporter (DMT)-like permease
VANGGDRTAAAAFIGSAVFAGGNAVGIRFSNRELDPLWGASLRFLFASVILAAVMAVLRLRVPRGKALAGALLFGVLTVGVSFGLLYYALLRLQAGLVQTLLALVPLATLLIAIAERQERFRVTALLGTVLAFAGITVMTSSPMPGSVPWPAVLATLGSVFCAAQGGVLVRAFPPVHPVAMNGVAMAAGAVLLLAASVVGGETQAVPRRAETWAALGFLVVVDSVLVSVLYLVVLRYWDASRASYLFVVIPVITAVLSAWLDAEPLTLSLLLGGALVLGGVYVGALRRQAGSAVPASR